ncbi:MAG: response regulator [Myxococcota bacterium]
MNLLTNASESLEGAPGEVRLRVLSADAAHLPAPAGELPAGDVVVLEVRDEGCGMDDDVRARMFDPYYTTKLTGRGLGLAALQAIVRHHRGAVRVVSTPGRGTTMQIWLPAGEPAADELVTPQLLTPTAPRRLGTVLLAEDEDVVRRVTTRMLLKLGYQVIAVRDGEQATEVLAEGRQDLVLALLDFLMPRCDGSRVLQQVRRLRPELPVVIMTGYAGPERDRAQVQPDVWLRKPFSVAELHAALEEAHVQEHRRASTPPPVSRSIAP